MCQHFKLTDKNFYRMTKDNIDKFIIKSIKINERDCKKKYVVFTQ